VIIVRQYNDDNASSQPYPILVIRATGPESVANLHKWLNRGINCWDNAPAEVKEASDIQTLGYISQDHLHQETLHKPLSQEVLDKLK
jgi:hypothetical protein